MKTYYYISIFEELSQTAIKYFYGEEKNNTIQKHFCVVYKLDENSQKIYKFLVHHKMFSTESIVSDFNVLCDESLEFQKQYENVINIEKEQYLIIKKLMKTQNKKLSLLNTMSDNDDIRYIAHNILKNNFKIDNALTEIDKTKAQYVYYDTKQVIHLQCCILLI